MTLPWLAVLREAFSLLILFAAPPLLAAALVSLVVALVQSRLSLQEPAMISLLRIGAGLVTLALCAPWIGAELSRFLTAILIAVPQLGRS